MKPATRQNTTTRHDRQFGSAGFTLLEVMVAMLVISIGLGAVIYSTGNSTWQATFLKQKTIANWVAENQIVLYRAKKTWTSASNKQGDVEMARVNWRWKMHISKTDEPSLRRIDVDVFLGNENVVKGSATGFIAKP